jgi:TRAP-type C4-dicarboxylate transport system permease large subunit
MAQITPPIGFNLFVMQKITHKDLPFIARAALPMFFIMLVMVVLLVTFPNLATWLPNLA